MLILASASKARRSLLNQLSINFEVMVSNIDEENSQFRNIKDLVQRLAIAKAQFVQSEIESNYNDLSKNKKILGVLGCDSLFEFNGEIFGKPKNVFEASQRLKMISSQSGVLHTGHCLAYRRINKANKREESFEGLIKGVVSTSIDFCEISDDFIDYYVNTLEPLKCAGGFSIDGKGSTIIKGINGCYSNVLGLSLPWLWDSLDKASINTYG
ncbi:nucleoside triphosphate pyrophosphatase [Prochlorococcus marinus]|uniref:nucleoside triphosphate pyrophosphatase n=1 Tax=Prochlorococcus marinus TaxID=1219 RepID=UPI0022B51D99|nr:nucleoside triphosphate pyrophosphatase [Prochlorococcus marinus]